jgi:hypothetical protein
MPRSLNAIPHPAGEAGHRAFTWLVLAAGLLCCVLASPVRAGDPEAGNDRLIQTGKDIFLRGILGSGQPLVSTRIDGMRVSGTDAACANCHQRSGLGDEEGSSYVPPITGRYLFHPRNAGKQYQGLPFVAGIRPNRDPYTEATLARAIRDGIDSDGKPLNYLMPHYALGDADMAALGAYLNYLGERKMPGVTDTVLHFATIITPDADPVKKRAMLAVLDQFFLDKNAFERGPSQQLLSTHVVRFQVNRVWRLHVWQLSGPPDTWQAQLKADFEREPVFAVISGLGGRTWAPVEKFCEAEEVPCLFPNIEVPPADADKEFYTLYFSKGLLLESGLVAHGILTGGAKPPKVVDQVYRAGGDAEAAARALANDLDRHGIRVIDHPVAAGQPPERVAAAVRKAKGTGALVLWLRPPDIAALNKVAPPAAPIYLSGTLGGLEGAPLPESWRPGTELAYPVALPEDRLINLDFALGWFRIHQIPVQDLRVQADTYLACGLLSEIVMHMVNTFVPEYLVERTEDMVEHRIITGYYPHLSLSLGQRYASKGGYLVRFAGPTGARLAANPSWWVP